jgi:superfamily I DNA/RNA helicase/RecB family exonuclease
MSDQRDQLNAAQRQAATWSGSPLIVLAGPGTGKTRVIAHRVKWLVDKGSRPETIVAVTYTVKAAQQLRTRLSEIIGPAEAEAVNVHTFHGLGMRLLRRFGDTLGLPASPDLIDSAQTKRLLRELVHDMRLFPDSIAAGRDSAIAAASQAMGILQDHAVEPADAVVRARAWVDAARRSDAEDAKADLARAETFLDQARLYEAFEKARRERGWLSFGDLLTLPIRLLRKDGRATAICRDEFRHFIVDEFQDSNPAQLALLRQLAPGKNADVCVVGDDDQSIYAFRGADDRAFEHFKKAYSAAGEVRLTENYRSVPEVVAASNRIISLATTRFAPDKVVVAAGKHEAPGSVECVALDENDKDAAAIAAMVLSDRAANPLRPWSAYAVLATSHAHLEHAATALELEGVPVRRQRSRSPMDDEGVQDVMAWINVLARPDDSWSARRVLLRPPYSLDPLTVTTWENLHRAEERRKGRERSTKPGFLSWLSRRREETLAGNEPAAAGLDDDRLGLVLEQHAELSSLAGTLSADEAIFQIVTRIDAAHADLPAEAGGHARSRRVADLVALVRFARDRQRRLSPPGDLAAFLAYYEDLDEREQQLEPTGDERLDANADADDPSAPPDAVTLLTAHSAKGLEFDTVFVMRVQPTGGFGKASRRDGPEISATILGMEDVDHDADDRAEQRRLFYVACTRAERRLVLLAKASKSRSKSTHYFQEFTLDAEGRKLVAARTGADVFEQAARCGLILKSAAVDGALAAHEATDFSALLARARSRARQAATLALEAADRPGLTIESLNRITTDLRDAAGRLAVAAAAKFGLVPDWSGESEAWRKDVQALAAGKAATLSGEFRFQPVGPRLDLSYSSVDHYLSCPRCWYVRHIMHVDEKRDEKLNVGGVVHRALQRFVERRRDAEANGSFIPGPEELARLCEEEATREAGPVRVVEPAELQQMVALGNAALVLESADGNQSPNVLEVEREFKFGYERLGTRHTMTAKIDRLDQLESGHLRIVDYKTGKASKKLTEPKKDDLQMGIYSMALASAYGGGAVPQGIAEYWLLSTTQRGTIDLAKLDLDAVRAEIDSMIDGVLSGHFPKDPKKCRGLCDILGLPHEQVGKGAKNDE